MLDCDFEVIWKTILHVNEKIISSLKTFFIELNLCNDIMLFNYFENRRKVKTSNNLATLSNSLDLYSLK